MSKPSHEDILQVLGRAPGVTVGQAQRESLAAAQNMLLKAMQYAAQRGHLDQVKDLATVSEDTVLAEAMPWAAEAGRTEVVRFMMPRVTRWQRGDAIVWAANGKNHGIVQMLLPDGLEQLSDAAAITAISGYSRIKLGKALAVAAAANGVETVKLLSRLGLPRSDLQDALVEAAKHDATISLEFLVTRVDHSALSYNALEAAAIKGSTNATAFLLQLGPAIDVVERILRQNKNNLDPIILDLMQSFVDHAALTQPAPPSPVQPLPKI